MAVESSQKDLKAATANLIIKAKQQQQQQKQQTRKPACIELLAAENDHNYTLARRAAVDRPSDEPVAGQANGRMDDCTAAMVLMFLSCRPGEEGSARESLSQTTTDVGPELGPANEPKNEFAKQHKPAHRADQDRPGPLLSGNIGGGGGGVPICAPIADIGPASNNNNNSSHHRHHQRHNDHRLQQLAPTGPTRSQPPATLLNDKQAGLKPTGPSQAATTTTTTGATKETMPAATNMKRNSQPIEMPVEGNKRLVPMQKQQQQQKQQHNKRPFDEESPLQPRGLFKFALRKPSAPLAARRRPGVVGGGKTIINDKRDDDEDEIKEVDEDDELDLLDFVETSRPKPEDEMIFELQQVDQVGEPGTEESGDITVAVTATTAAAAAAQPSATLTPSASQQEQSVTTAMDWNGCNIGIKLDCLQDKCANKSDNDLDDHDDESHRLKKAKVSKGAAQLATDLDKPTAANGDHHEQLAASDSDKRLTIRANNLGDLNEQKPKVGGNDNDSRDEARLMGVSDGLALAETGTEARSSRAPTPPPLLDEQQLRRSFQQQLERHQLESRHCLRREEEEDDEDEEEEEEEDEDEEDNHLLRFGLMKQQQQQQQHQQQQQQLQYQLQSTKMRTIFSCMWPSCSVNCDSLEDIERHVRAHLGCKQYESIGDEDFYYEETEVDEPTYLAIFNHHPSSGTAVAVATSVRHHASHHLHHSCSHAANSVGGVNGGVVVVDGVNNTGKHHRPGAQSPSHNSDGLSSGQSFASSSPATSPVCSTDSSPPSSASSSSSLSYHAHHHHYHLDNRVFSGGSLSSATAPGGNCSTANSIDWNQFLASSSLVALEQQQLQLDQQRKQQHNNNNNNNNNLLPLDTTTAMNNYNQNKRNNLNKWPSSSSSQRQQQLQQVYLAGINSQQVPPSGAFGGGDSSPFSVRCDFADQAKATAQPIICDATIFMHDQQTGLSQQGRNRSARAKPARLLASAKRQQQLDSKSSNSNHRNNRTKSSGINIDDQQRQHQRRHDLNNSNQKNQNQMSSSLQFSMQLTGGGFGYGHTGAIYQPTEQQLQHDRQRANNQRLASSQNQADQDNSQEVYYSQQLDESDRNTMTMKTRRGRRPGTKAMSNKTAAGKLKQAATKLKQGQHNQSNHHQTATYEDDEADDDDDLHHQQIFQTKQHQSSKLLANKTITRTSAPLTTPTSYATSNSPTASASAVPLLKQAATNDEDQQHHQRRLSSGSFSSSSLSMGASQKAPSGSGRRVRGENRKCRKVYGMERRDQWCTQCKWKKACTRFSGADGKLLLLAANNDS